MFVQCPACSNDLNLVQESSCYAPTGICSNCEALVVCTLSKSLEYEITATPKEHRVKTVIDSSLLLRYNLPSPLSS